MWFDAFVQKGDYARSTILTIGNPSDEFVINFLSVSCNIAYKRKLTTVIFHTLIYVIWSEFGIPMMILIRLSKKYVTCAVRMLHLFYLLTGKPLVGW